MKKYIYGAIYDSEKERKIMQWLGLYRDKGWFGILTVEQLNDLGRLLDDKNKEIWRLQQNIRFILGTIEDDIKKYQYHNQITASTNVYTMLKVEILEDLVEKIKDRIGEKNGRRND